MLTNPNPRIERILLLSWTFGLAGLIVFQFGAIPPAIAWTLLPYLALVARHLTASNDRDPDTPVPALAEPAETEPAKAPETMSASEPEPGRDSIEPDPRPIPTRPRRRARPRLAVAEPAPAAWVEVAPGRFVRGESPEPAPPSGPTFESGPSDPPADDATPEPASESPRKPGDRGPIDLTP